MKTILNLIIMIAAVSCGQKETSPEKKVEKIVRQWEDPASDFDKEVVEKVDKLVSASKAEIDGEAENHYTIEYLDKKTVDGLNENELLYYCLAYPASYSQNCAADTEGDSTKAQIARYLPDEFDSHSFSSLQKRTLEKNREQIIPQINKLIERHPEKTDVAYLYVLRDLNAIESIPVVVKTASEKNTGNYTLLVNLMIGYPSFYGTAVYSKLFKDDNVARNIWIDASEYHMNIIKERAEKLYKEQSF